MMEIFRSSAAGYNSVIKNLASAIELTMDLRVELGQVL